jgi:competence protein ComEA
VFWGPSCAPEFTAQEAIIVARINSILFRPWLAVWAALCAPALMAGPVNLNTADAATIAKELKGIGLTRAQAIVDYRAKHGPFKSPDELALVKGIGKKAIERNRADIVLERRAAPAPAAKPALK